MEKPGSVRRLVVALAVLLFVGVCAPALLGYLRKAASPVATDPSNAAAIEVPTQEPYVPQVIKDCGSMTTARPSATLVAGRWDECRVEFDLPAGTVIYAPFDGYFSTGGEGGTPVPLLFMCLTEPITGSSSYLDDSIMLRGYFDLPAGEFGPVKKGTPLAIATGKKIDGRSHNVEIRPFSRSRYGYKELESFFVRAGLIPVEVSSEDMTGYVPQTMKDSYGRFLEAVHDFSGTLVPRDRMTTCQFRFPMWGVGFDLPEAAKVFAPFDCVLVITGSTARKEAGVTSVILFPTGSWTETGGRVPCVFATGDFDLNVPGSRRVRKGELIGTINGKHLLKGFLTPEDNFNLVVTLETLADNDWLETLSFYLRTRLVVPPGPFRDKYLTGEEGEGQTGPGGEEAQQNLPPLLPPKTAPSVFESLYKSPLVASDVRESLARRGEPLGYVHRDRDSEGRGFCAVVLNLPEGTPLRLPFDAVPMRFYGFADLAGKAWDCAIQGTDSREVSFSLMGVKFDNSLSMDKSVVGGTVVGTACGDLIPGFEGQGNVVVVLTSLNDREAALAAFAERLLTLK